MLYRITMNSKVVLSSKNKWTKLWQEVCTSVWVPTAGFYHKSLVMKKLEHTGLNDMLTVYNDIFQVYIARLDLLFEVYIGNTMCS